MHGIIERNRFSFAIGIGTELDFFRGFPLRRKSVWDRPQISDPMVDQGDGKVLLFAGCRGGKNRSNAKHLAVVGGGIDRDVIRLSESGEAGETKQGQSDEPDFAQGIRVDAYRNHINYNH